MTTLSINDFKVKDRRETSKSVIHGVTKKKQYGESCGNDTEKMYAPMKLFWPHRADPPHVGDDRPGARRHVAPQRVRSAQPALLLPQRQVSRGDVGQGRRHASGDSRAIKIVI